MCLSVGIVNSTKVKYDIAEHCVYYEGSHFLTAQLQ